MGITSHFRQPYWLADDVYITDEYHLIDLSECEDKRMCTCLCLCVCMRMCMRDSAYWRHCTSQTTRSLWVIHCRSNRESLQEPAWRMGFIATPTRLAPSYPTYLSSPLTSFATSPSLALCNTTRQGEPSLAAYRMPLPPPLPPNPAPPWTLQGRPVGVLRLAPCSWLFWLVSLPLLRLKEDLDISL